MKYQNAAMKKIYFLICLLATGFAGISQQLLFEPFNYTPDPTNGLFTQSAGLWTRINTGDSILVTSGSLSYPGLAASTGNKVSYDNAGADYYTGFTSQTTGTVYGSFILNIASITATTTGAYFTSFIQDASTSSFGGAVWVRSSTTAGKYNIGVSTRSNSAVSWLTADLDPGTSYFVVFAYEMVAGTANDVAKIWLNTTAIGGTEPAPDATAVPGTDLSSVARVLLRQDNTTNMPFFVQLDEYRIGTTWASVTPGNAPAPALSASTLTGFGNTCINTTTTPNSFTITGTNLTTADVTVAALPGYSFSTTAGGTYTSTLNITQPGGAFNQTVFVKFSPTAVQPYNGNIVVGGGGATAINVAVTGSGVNAAPAVTTGSASAITTSSATVAGSITDQGCTALTAYGIEYSLTSGFANGTGTQVPSTNLSGTSFTSALSGLNAGTTYYYKAYATNAGGTTYGAEQSFVTASFSPTLTSTTLNAFGNVCVNTTAGTINSFTINGTNLTNANITVGPLAGFQFATVAGGPFSPTLTLTQPGGTFTQQVFVQFNPTAVQSYNGNIPVAGGGASGSINVAASGSGVNSAPAVTTGASSAITTTTATLGGSITDAGCTALTAYGIEYSTINGFANGTGTAVPSTNLTGTTFTSALTGLTPSTTYYYKAYATNAAGTTYGLQQSFMTSAPPPATLTATALTAFGNVCVGDSNTASFTLTGSNLTTAAINVGPFAGYSFSTTATGNFTPSLTLTQGGGSFNQVVFVRFRPAAVQAYNGNIPVTGGGASALNVAVTGTGVNTRPDVVTGTVSAIRTDAATVSGSITGSGCSVVTEYGFEYSGISNFIPGTGTKDSVGSGVSAGSFSSTLTGLVPGTVYYVRAYATNNGGTAYGAEQTFTTLPIPNGLTIYPQPAILGRNMNFSLNNLKPGYLGIELYNSAGQQVYRRHFNVQGSFINDRIMIPYNLAVGVYGLRIINDTEVLEKRTILITN